MTVKPEVSTAHASCSNYFVKSINSIILYIQIWILLLVAYSFAKFNSITSYSFVFRTNIIEYNNIRQFKAFASRFDYPYFLPPSQNGTNIAQNVNILTSIGLIILVNIYILNCLNSKIEFDNFAFVFNLKFKTIKSKFQTK